MNWAFWRNNTEKRSIDTDVDAESDTRWGWLGGLGFGLTKGGRNLSLSAVFSAIELICNSIAILPITIKNIKDGGKEINTNHSLNIVFNSMLLSPVVWLKQMLWDLYTTGNAYSYIKRSADGTVTEIVYCEPADVTIDYKKNKRELYYRINNLYGVTGKVEPINVIHIIKNSKDGIKGIGVLDYARETLQTASATDKQAQQYFESGCNIAGLLKTGSPNMSARQIADAKASWNSVYGSGKNNKGLVVLPKDWDYQAIASNASDAQMLESRIFNIEEIARFMNISPILLGDLSKSSYSTIEQANLDFLTHTLLPIIILVEKELNRKLLKPSEYGKIIIDLDENVLMRTDKSTTATYLNTLVSGGIITVNEARIQLGLNPIEGGDRNIIAYTKIEDNTINKQDNDNTNNGEKEEQNE